MKNFWKFGPKTNVSLWPISRKKRFNLQDGKVFKSLVNIKKVHVTDEQIIIPFYISDKCIHCITIDSILYFNINYESSL